MRVTAIVLAIVVGACAGTNPESRDAADRAVPHRSLGHYRGRTVTPIGNDVIVAGPEGIARVHPQTGDIRWRDDATVLSRSVGPAVGAEEVVFADEGDVVVVEADSGVERWRAHTEAPGLLAPVVVEHLVVVADTSAKMVAFDRVSGVVRWRHDLLGTHDGRASGRLVAPAGSVCVTLTLSDQAQLICVDVADGTTRWSRRVSLPVSAPAAADDELVIGAGRDGIAAFDARAGALRWQNDMPGLFSETVAPVEFGDGWVVFDRVGNVRHVLGGEVRWGHTVDAVFVNSQPTVAAELVWVSDGSRLHGIDKHGEFAGYLDVEGVATHDFWSMAGGRGTLFVVSEASGLTVAKIR